MKYLLYTMFFIFGIILVYFFKSAFEVRESSIEITGSEKCGRCHSLNNLGNQYDKWKSERHSSAYLSLLSEKASKFTSEKSINSPEKNEFCLKCHTTKYFLNFPSSNAYDIKEGIGCEGCHGAGSVYSPADKHSDRKDFIINGGIIPDEKTCRKCHSPEGNPLMEIRENVCPFQYKDFNFSEAMTKIKHPLIKNE
ncbi:MAG: cytochrome c family protein [Ignavibacteria bacterium]|nr:cytochrome c family protein [Ignavibacteria bacterium]